MVARDLNRRASIVQDRARARAGVESGRLRASIVKRVAEDSQGLVVYVGSHEPHARLHHEGTDPHVIEPRAVGGWLRFEVQGVVVYATAVNHPGTRPNRYLTESLRG
jgi:hypothetical protein